MDETLPMEEEMEDHPDKTIHHLKTLLPSGRLSPFRAVWLPERPRQERFICTDGFYSRGSEASPCCRSHFN